MKPGFPAQFSEDGRYRYVLWREWTFGSGCVMFIGLNPSTANETRNDATLRRCIRFAKDWGFQSLCMTNLFAICATDPGVMKKAADPIGPENSYWLSRIASHAKQIIVCWGNDGNHMDRCFRIRRLLEHYDLYHLGRTNHNHPKHPLRLRADTKPEKW